MNTETQPLQERAWDLSAVLSSDFFRDRMLPAIIMVICAYIIGRVLGGAIRLVAGRYAGLPNSVQRLIGGAVSGAFYLIGLIAALQFIGVNTTGLLAAISALGLAVGLALKDTLGNIASGMLLMFQRLIADGDFISTPSVMGTVESVSLFATTLNTPDGIRVSLPNSVLWGEPITNYSKNPVRRLAVSVRISYGDSVDAGLRALLKAGAEEPRRVHDKPMEVFVSDLADSAVNLTLRLWVRREVYWGVMHDLTKAAKLAVEAAGLKIPVPQREVVIRDDRQ